MRRHLAIALASLMLAAVTVGARAEDPPPAEPKASAPEHKPAEKPAEPPAKPKQEAPPAPREEAAPKPPEAAPKPPEKAESPSKPEDAAPKPATPKAAEPKAPPPAKAREASRPPRSESPAKDQVREPRKTGSISRPGDETAAPKQTKAATPAEPGAGKSTPPQRRTGSRPPPADPDRSPVMVVCDETRNDNGLRFIIHAPGPAGVRLSLFDKGGKEIERDLIAASANIAHARIVWGLRNYPAERMLRGTFLITAGDRNRALSGVMLGYDGAGSLLSFAASLTRNDEDPRRWALSLGQERRFNCREPRGEAETANRSKDGDRAAAKADDAPRTERPPRRPARDGREPRRYTTP